MEVAVRGINKRRSVVVGGETMGVEVAMVLVAISLSGSLLVAGNTTGAGAGEVFFDHTLPGRNHQISRMIATLTTIAVQPIMPSDARERIMRSSAC